MADDRGDCRRADSLAQEALRILRQAHGEQHPSGGRRHGTDRRDAAQLGEVASGGYHGPGGHRHAARPRPRPDALRRPESLNDLALSRAYQGDHAEALALMHRVVALDSALFGSSHPDLAAHLENLGLVYDLSGFPDSNVAVLRQALAIRRAMLADDDPAIGRSLFNLAVAEYVKRDYAAAEPLYEEGLTRMRQAYGPEHPDVVYGDRRSGPEPVLSRPCRRGGAEPAVGVRREGSQRPNAAERLREARTRTGVPAARPAPLGRGEPVALRVLAIRDSLADTLAQQTAKQLVTLYEGWGSPGARRSIASGQRRRATPCASASVRETIARWRARGLS